MPQADRRWLHLIRTSDGAFDICEFPPPRNATLDVALLDPYFVSGADVTPLGKILPALLPSTADMDAIVIRVEEAPPSENFEEIAEALRFQRGKALEIAVLGPAGGAGMRCAHVGGATAGVQVLTDALRELEFHAQLRRSGAIYRPDKAHVILPSGAHASEYVRVADMFNDHAAVRRAADWLEQRVMSDTILVGDTWTIMPLLQELSARAAAIAMGARSRTAPPILCFSSYPEPEEVRQTLRRVSSLAASRTDAKALFIISVASSGALLENLEALSERNMPGVPREVIAIANADRRIQVESLCVLDDIQRFRADDCDLCRSMDRRPTIRIDRKRYFPSVSVERIPVMITPTAARKHGAFWEVADRKRAVRLHAAVVQGSPLAGRSGGETGLGEVVPIKRRDIAIDVAQLLKDPKFKEDVCEALSIFQPRCDLVVVPAHGASEALHDLAQVIYPKPRPVTLEHGQREELKEKLLGARRILILDDVIVSGTTVRSIHRMIQDILHEFSEAQRHEDYTISVFVIIGRPQTEALWKRLEDSLQQGPRRTYLKRHISLLLPDDRCPWCDERSRLRRVQTQRSKPVVAGAPRGALATAGDGPDEVDDFIEERLRRLNPPQDARLTGLADSIFLCGATGEFASDDTLTSNSFFGEALHEATAYAAVAAAMHAIRVEQNQTLQGRQGVAWHWDLARIITAYHDPIIQASFLRAAKPEELVLENQAELDAAVKEAFYLTDDPDRQVSLMLAAEHKWAALAQKHVMQAREAFTKKADEVIARHKGGENGARAARMEKILASLQAELLLPIQPVERSGS